MMTKDEIRAVMRERRRALTPEARKAASACVCAQLAALGLHSPVAVYLASPQEIDLSPFIRKRLELGNKIVAPRWNGEAYELAVLKGLDAAQLRKGPNGILEPVEAEIVPPSEVLAWLVPGLAFTLEGGRLGYGGGWYDRLLGKAPKSVPKIAVAYDFQLVERLPTEPHDIWLTSLVVSPPIQTFQTIRTYSYA